jgi:NitT/TauT family transport system permease protein
MKENGLLFPAVSPSIERKGAAARTPQRRIRFDLISIPFVLAGLILLWGGLVYWQGYPAFILPGPVQVWNKAVTMTLTGILWKHAQITLIEIGLGLLIGLSLALLLGYVLGKNQTLDRLLSPYIVASQTIPIVAVAPLLVIWFGSGITSKILICALIVFFPTLVSTMVGIHSVDPDLRDLMRSLRANRWQIFTKLELPAALPILFGGLKLSVILSVVGAVVGEFVGADVGLGFLINLGRGVLDTPMIFVAVFALVLIAQALYLIVSLLESYFLRWRR